MNIKTIVLATLLLANTAFAENASKPAGSNSSLSGKPYASPTNLDTSLPDLGDASQTVLTPLDEQYIGEQIMREVALSDEILQDIEVIDYLNRLGNKLAAASPDKQQKFNFFVVQDNSINAFAMPGQKSFKSQ